MSNWVNVIGTLEIETYHEDLNIIDYVKNILKSAPKITGSESDADIFVNIPNGYNTYIECDCSTCKYGDSVEYLENGWFECDADNNYKCPNSEYQTVVIITIVGDLRDRHKEQTQKEVKEFLNFINNQNWDINNYSITINDYNERENFIYEV